jgi:hypothetical protein
MGQLFHYNSSPNRYGIPAFYALHVWVWLHNPHGFFVDWNPKVSYEEHTARAASHMSPAHGARVSTGLRLAQ